MQTNTKLIDVSTDAAIADALGAARAAAQNAQNEVKFLEGLLKAKGVTEVEGELFRVKIAYGIETARVNWKAVAERLNPSRQLLQAHTAVSTADRVTVTARKKLDD